MRVLRTSIPGPGEYVLRFEEEIVPGEKDEAGNPKRPYAILSHAWEDEEVIYTDVVERNAKRKKGYTKLENAITQARLLGYEYLWADTACIDKRHSAELQEAINSMYSWYRQAEICLAYLADVPTDDAVDSPHSKFVKSRWFERGWTLQELVAPEPENVEFFSQDWKPLGNRVSRSHAIAMASGIDVDILEGKHTVETASIAKRMSWAAKRRTKRPEDWAYCLIGLFKVNMTMIYGEGLQNAFLRLQEEIMKNSDDHSIFAWVDRDADPSTPHGLLASTPAAFGYQEANNLISYTPWGELSAYVMTNRGLHIELHLTPVQTEDTTEEYVAALNCPHPKTQSGFLSIKLKKLSREQDQFVRVDCHKFTAVRERGELTSVLVPQMMPDPKMETVYPLHILLFRPIETERSVSMRRRFEFEPSDKRLLGAIPDRAFKVAKKERQWAAAIHLGSTADEEGFVILLGTRGKFDVGFTAVEAESLDCKETADAQANFRPRSSGSTVNLRDQDVRVDLPESARMGIKTFEVYVTIQGRGAGGSAGGILDEVPQVPIKQAIDFARGVLNPSYQPVERPQRRDKFYRSMGLRR